LVRQRQSASFHDFRRYRRRRLWPDDSFRRALKEGIDATGSGDPSWKDFTWDVIGAAVGLAVAWGVDAVVHGGKMPPMVATAGSRAATIAVHF
jgi:hypothetical protein